jgi:tape measure domain-containing protein
MAYTASQGAVISFSVEGVAASQRQVDSLAQSMSSLTNVVQSATRNLAAGIGIGGGVSQIVQLSDEYTKLTSQLRLATDSTAAYAAAYSDVKRIAGTAQSDLAGTGVLYARVAKSTKELGVSQKGVADITEVVNLSLKVSAASSEEAASANLQLSQAFASGTLRGEEFNAVNEAAPRLMQALADGMGVPIGALKDMASNGLITSEVMAQVLPKSLEQLREEAKQVQTVGGAWQVLKNNVLEFTATTAQSNGSVAAITGAINLLSNNLPVLAGGFATITAVKLGTWLTNAADRTLNSVTASRALVVSNLASAESSARATAQTSLLANARLAEVRAATLAATGETQLALTTNALIPAQARATAAAEAHTLAMTQLAIAQRAASIAATAASTVITALGGPLGVVITVLGIAATAWQWYASSSEDANRRAQESTEESDSEIVANLDKQTQKLRERVALAKQGGFQLDVAKDGGPGAERLAGYLTKINDLKAKGNQLTAVDQVMLVNLEGLYNTLLQSATAYKQVKDELDATGSAAKDVIEIRQRLTGVNKQYLEDLSKLETAREKGAVSESEYIDLITKLATETYKSSDAGKEATSAANKAKEAYASLISSIREKIDSNRLEAKVNENATESQKALIKLDQETAAGKLKLSSAQMANARAAIAELGASEQVLKKREAERDVAKWIMSSTQARAASVASLDAEYATYGKTADARDIAMVAVRAQADMERKLAEMREAKKPVTDEMIAQLQAETAERVKVEQATLAQSKALGYAGQLALENKRTAAEAISDPRQREQALVEIDANVWRERIRLAGDGTQAQKALQEEFDTWYANRKNVAGASIDLTQASALLDILTAVDDAAKSAAQGMEASFGRVGAAVGKLSTSFTGFHRNEAAIASQRAAAIKDAGGDQVKIQKANDIAAEASAQIQMQAYGDMASAAKGFFKENSTGYKVMEGVEKAYRAAEMVMALEATAKKILFKETEVTANTALNATKLTGEATASAASTGLAATEASAWGITAVVKAIASLPFPLNLAAGAATLAAVVAIGAKVVGGLGGSGASLSQQRQEAQGTGTVLGDKSAKSESIARAIELSASNSSTQINYLSAMTNSLRAIESNISSFAAELVRTTDFTGAGAGTLNSNNGAATNAVQVGTFAAIGTYFGPIGTAIGALVGVMAKNIPILGKIATSIFGGKQSVADSGITMSPTQLSEILTSGAKLSQYTDIKTSGGWFSGDKYSTQSTPLDATANQQITTVLKSMADSIKIGAGLLGVEGDEFTAKLNSYVVDLDVSLKDLKGDDLQKALESAFSKLGDDIAQYAVSGLEQFEKVGEGYLETLVRVASDSAKLDASLASIGTTFGATGLASIAARESLIELMGGIDELQSTTADFAENFLTEAQRLAPVQKYVSDELAKLNLSWVDTREEFAQVVLGLDKTTAAGQATYATLMGLEAAFAATHEAIKDTTKSAQDIADERSDLQDQIDELTMTAIQLRAKERAGIADDNKALYDHLQALKDHAAGVEKTKDAATTLLAGVDSAFTALQSVVSREKTAVQAMVDAHSAAVTKLQSLSDALHSTLDSLQSPDQKLAERAVGQAQIRAALAIAKAGGPLPDADGLKDALSAVQQDASDQFSTYADYLRDLYQTQNDIGALAGLTDSSLTVEEQALQAAKDQLTSLDGILTNAQALIDEAKGQSTTLLSIDQAMGTLTAAILAAQANPVVSATSSINQAYQQALGRTPDAAGLEFWQNQAAAGTSTSSIVSAITGSAEAKNRAAISQLYKDLLGRDADAGGLSFYASNGSSLADVASAIKSSDEYKKLHPFAIGTNYVPEDMPAFIHAGERIIPAGDNRELMRRLSSPSENSAALVAELRALRAEVQALREDNSAENLAIAKGTQATADHLDSAVNGDVPFATKVVPA